MSIVLAVHITITASISLSFYTTFSSHLKIQTKTVTSRQEMKGFEQLSPAFDRIPTSYMRQHPDGRPASFKGYWWRPFLLKNTWIVAITQWFLVRPVIMALYARCSHAVLRDHRIVTLLLAEGSSWCRQRLRLQVGLSVGAWQELDQPASAALCGGRPWVGRRTYELRSGLLRPAGCCGWCSQPGDGPRAGRSNQNEFCTFGTWSGLLMKCYTSYHSDTLVESFKR